MPAVQLWRFSKARNNTAIPSINEYDRIVTNATWKDSCDIINNPVLLLDLIPIAGEVEPFESYTYAEFSGRYYFITKWVFDRGLWEAYMELDVLGTYRYLIGNSKQFITRCSVVWDSSISDSLYPMSTKSYSRIIKPSSYFATPEKPSFEYGDFVIGVLDGNGEMGSVSYYVLDAIQLSKLTKELFDNALYMGVSSAEISSELLQSLVNPMQYIVSCMWFPFSMKYGTDYVSGSLSHNLKLGWWYPNIKCSKILQNCETYRVTIPIDTHLQYNTFGQFVNAAPYSEYTLYLPGFGDIPLDSNTIAQYITDSETKDFEQSLTIDITVDYITGKAVAKDVTGAGFVQTINGRIGVPIQLSQSSVDYVGAAVGAIQTASSVFSGGIGGAISNAATGIANVAKSLSPQVSTTGSNGSFLDCIGQNMPALIIKWRLLPDEVFPEKFGRPYCGVGCIKDIGSGFFMIAAPKFSESELNNMTNRPAVEHVAAICELMEKGFFYE